MTGCRVHRRPANGEAFQLKSSVDSKIQKVPDANVVRSLFTDKDTKK